VSHDDLSAREPDPEALAGQRRACEQLDRVLDALPLELRSVFVLFELEGMTSPEIASVAGLPLGTVASRLRRARERFHALCQDEPDLSPPKEDEP
jgi:RNA polymerase sigma-70 factor (ECF subfamily)